MEKRISGYTAAKDALKAELRDILHRYSDSSEDTVSDAAVTSPCSNLRRRRRPGSPMLDMAESIREGLRQAFPTRRARPSRGLRFRRS